MAIKKNRHHNEKEAMETKNKRNSFIMAPPKSLSPSIFRSDTRPHPDVLLFRFFCPLHSFIRSPQKKKRKGNLLVVAFVVVVVVVVIEKEKKKKVLGKTR